MARGPGDAIGRLGTVGAALVVVGLAGAGGCSYGSRRPPEEHTISTTPADGPVEGRAGFEMAIPIPGHRACLVPFVIESRKGAFQDGDPYTRGGYMASASRVQSISELRIAPAGAAVRWHNAVVVDLNSGAAHAVLDGRGVISQCWWLGPVDERGALTRTDLLLLTVTREDSNADGAIDDLDARETVLVSAEDWRPRVVTPPSTQVWEVRYDPSWRLVYFLVLPDSTGDGRFTDADSAEAWVLDPSRDGAARPLVDGAMRDRLEMLAR